VANEDIVAFYGSNFSLYFDGSDVGVGGFTLDAFAIVSPSEILMSFTEAGSIGTLGTVDDSDIVKFTATSLGITTAGTFSLYFDGSDIGLTTSFEDVDAIELVGGNIHLSTTDSFGVNGLSGADEDVFVCNNPTTGSATACGSLSLYFDGSDVSLTSDGEDVDGLAVAANGNIYLSTISSFSINGLSGANEDIFVCNNPTTGTNTACASWTLFFDGSNYGLSSNDLFAIDLP